jgi:branched-chain amino acid transport system substrate-binding protein
MRWIPDPLLALLALALLPFVAATAGCVEEEPCEGSCVELLEGEVLRLGVAAATTSDGLVGEVGTATARAIQLAVEQRGELAGRPLGFVVEPSGCSSEGGAQALTALKDAPGVFAVIGPTCSVAAASAMEAAGSGTLAVVSPSNTSPLLTRPDRQMPGYLRVAPSDAEQAERMARYLGGALELGTAIALHDGSEHLEAIAQDFGLAFQAEGGQLVGFEDVGDSLDLLEGELIHGAPDLLFLALPASRAADVATLVRTELALDALVLAGTDVLDDPAFLDAEHDVSEGALLTRFAFNHVLDGYETFAADWEQRFGEPPSAPFHAHAWDAAQMALRAIEEVAVPFDEERVRFDRQAVHQALAATSGQAGLTGMLTCDELGDCAAPTPVDLLIVEDGQPVGIPGP